ncbi:hypothetical protein NPS01_37920 [Nocardioides psychrotolerans]|uniref:Uncharacterized protein n=1 Tax=Nocardioides psychrotolerans TaxID=1005945 RepID=A0A1I3I8V5_9ACTN|nr:hypothetical protein [Nocardioides psychrotolerans]GEP40129.1 hypothetical protein NPS01_37920 [Nocardioides psychrotolerans]SFI44183.1 hypothetical protein SAMN05216561_108160 [Nocardioides psychrotolerans]
MDDLDPETRPPPSPANARAAALGVVVLALGLMVALGLVAAALDRRTDWQRPMYEDVLAVAQLEWEQIQLAGAPLEFALTEDGRQVLGGQDVVLSPGTTSLSVQVEGKTYCVGAANERGDETGALCFDGEGLPDSILDHRVS